MQTGASLNKEDMKVVPQAQKSLGALDRIIDDIVKRFGAVTDLSDRHAGTFEIQKLLLNLFENGKGECCGTRIKIVDSLSHCFFSLLSS